MEEDFLDLLTGDAGIVALVGANTGSLAGPSIYWHNLPQASKDPNVVLYLISGGENYTMRGPSSLVGRRVQIDVRALSQTKAWEVSRAIKTRLSGFKGVQGSTQFDGIFLDSERQETETPKDKTYYRVSMDFLVWSKPA